MNKGLLFAIPMILAVIVAFALANVTMYAPWFAAGVLFVGIAVVLFYIRGQKHNDTTNEPGKS